MKNIFIILLFYICVSINLSHIYAYSDVKNVSYEQNTELNIKGAQLIEKYLHALLLNLDTLKSKYNLEKNDEIKNYTKTLNSMITLLSKIQNKNISKQKAEDIMRIIINELKPLNKNIKLLLKKEKQKQKQKNTILKERYYKLSSNLSLKLDKLILNFYIPIKNKLKLNKKDEKILLNLRILKKNSDKLKQIKEKNIESITEVKKEILIIIQNIKKSLINIKNI